MKRQKIKELEFSNRKTLEKKQRKVSLEDQLETAWVVKSIDAKNNALIREKLTLDEELEEKVNKIKCIDDKNKLYVNNFIKQVLYDEDHT